MDMDSNLLDMAKSMNEDALAKIFDLYSPPLYSYALRFCKDPLVADHIVGDVFAKLLDHLSAGKGPTTNLRSYLFQTAYHLLVDELRSSHRKISLEKFDLLQPREHTELSDIEKHLLYQTINRAMLRDLTDYQRNVIILRFLEGFNLRETAAILGKSVNVIKAAQHHAIMTLRSVVRYQDMDTTSVTTRGM